MTASRLEWAVARYAQAAGTAFDAANLRAAVSLVAEGSAGYEALVQVASGLGIGRPLPVAAPDPAHLPMLAWLPDGRWGVVEECSAEGYWKLRSEDNEVWLPTDALRGRLAVLPLDAGDGRKPRTSFAHALWESIREHRGVLLEASLASLVMGVLTVAISLFSMQVYDRVIPTRNEYTLVVLCSGVLLILLIDTVMRFARSRIMDSMVVGVDARLSRNIFQRLMEVRVDQFPGSVGSLAAQLRGYEQVRAFYTASTLFSLADLPIAVLLLILIAIIGSVWVALVPLVAACIGLALGFYYRKRINALALIAARENNLKVGLLVEAVEGIETIKSGGGGWKFLSRWIKLTGRGIQNDLQTRHATENLGYATNALQQLSYIFLITVGALVVIKGDMTMGAMIACSILGGRVLAPVMAIPGLMVQKAHADAAEDGLEQLYKLETDNHGFERPLTPATLRGHYQFADAKFQYTPAEVTLHIPQLEIRAGERVAVIGAVGSGKSTLLRLFSGLYRPQQGKVLLDGLDMAQIAPQVMTRHIGYLQQDHRLFLGTVRDNLLIGMPDPDDEVLRDALMRTGLHRLVAAHPLGIHLPISEGGKGLSGGQRQLVAFTRLLLMQSSILLLDEPTASMDEAQERQCIGVLQEQLKPGTTLVLVTHRRPLLGLVDRIVVLANGRVALDGPRDQVLARLQQGAQPATPSASTQPVRQMSGHLPINPSARAPQVVVQPGQPEQPKPQDPA